MKGIDPSRWVIHSSPKTGLRIPLQFKFTAYETKSLEKILRSFDPTDVKNFFFVSGLGYIPLFVVFKTRTFPKNAIKNHLRGLKQCRKTMEKILRGFDPDPQRNFPSLKDPRIRLGEAPWNICFENAEKALPHIRVIESTLAKLLEENKKGRGQPQADQEGFVEEVAKLYETIFHRKPSKAKNGIFCNLINELFGIIFPKEDHSDYDKSKTVERALDKLHAG